MAHEQRKQQRFKAFHVMRAMGPSGNQIHQSTLVNMSEGGLLFYSTESVEPKSRIRIHIEIPEFNSSIAVGGEVKWVQRAMEQHDSYFVGVEFIDLRDIDRGVIREIGKKSDPA